MRLGSGWRSNFVWDCCHACVPLACFAGGIGLEIRDDMNGLAGNTNGPTLLCEGKPILARNSDRYAIYVANDFFIWLDIFFYFTPPIAMFIISREARALESVPYPFPYPPPQTLESLQPNVLVWG